MPTLKFVLGVFLEIFSSLSIVWCIAVLTSVSRLAFQSRRSSIYIISAANILADVFTLLNYIVYLAPCIITDSFIFWGEKYHPAAIFLSLLAASCWFIISFSHILVALNRLVVLCFNSTHFFTYSRVLLLVALIFPVSCLLAIYIQLIAPCCMLLHDHEKMSFTYEFVPGIANYANLYVHSPVNFVTSGFCAVCYVIIYLHIRKAIRSGTGGLGRKKKEYVYAVQFFAISVFHLLIWVSLRLFPMVIDISQPGASNWLVITAICQILSSLVTTVVYSFFNSEVAAHPPSEGSRFQVKATLLQGAVTQTTGITTLRTLNSNLH